MYPFNLQRALAGEKLITRDGRSVSDFSKSNGVSYPYQAKINNSYPKFTHEGRFFTWVESRNDLMMAEQSVKFYGVDGKVFPYYVMAQIEGKWFEVYLKSERIVENNFSAFNVFVESGKWKEITEWPEVTNYFILKHKTATSIEKPVKFYCHKDHKFWSGRECIAVQNEKFSYHHLYGPSDYNVDPNTVTNWKGYIEVGIYIEVTNWPENITNEFILKHKTKTMRPDIKKVFIKQTSEQDFCILKGMFIQAGIDVGDRDFVEAGYCNFFNPEFGKMDSGPVGCLAGFPGYEIFNSLQDYINNVRSGGVRLNSKYEAVFRDGKWHIGCRAFSKEQITAVAELVRTEVTLNNSCIRAKTKEERVKLRNFFKFTGKNVSVLSSYIDRGNDYYWGEKDGMIHGNSTRFKKHAFDNLDDFLSGNYKIWINDCHVEFEKEQIVVTYGGETVIIPNSAILELEKASKNV